jgi:hypothetical protein
MNRWAFSPNLTIFMKSDLITRLSCTAQKGRSETRRSYRNLH